VPCLLAASFFSFAANQNGGWLHLHLRYSRFCFLALSCPAQKACEFTFRFALAALKLEWACEFARISRVSAAPAAAIARVAAARG